ncbi:hypothetical protein AURDEDRAFT_173801 [Auricularia subglabra TFB-10046 SS5]|nr:hypothetical protein AURDEDRAFT_173801 [Auricularia subglabra TFB-10046 SS5]
MASVAVSLATSVKNLLQDERRPHELFCPICLLNFPALLAKDGEPEIPILQTRHHGFLDTCMKNLSVPLTEGESLVLRARLQNNILHCQIPKYESHTVRLRDSDHSHVDDPRDLMNSMLCGVLVACLYGFDRKSNGSRVQPPVGRARSLHKPFRSTKGLWPASVDQLFPYGPERTVERIIECCCSFASAHGLLLLSALLELARPRMWHAVLQPTNLHRLIWAVSATVLLSLPGGHEKLSLDPGLTPPGCKVPARWRDAAWLREGHSIEVVATLLYTMRAGNYAHPDDGVRIASAHADLLDPAVRAILAPEFCCPDAAKETFERYRDILQHSARTRELDSVDEAELVRVVERDPRNRAVLAGVRLALQWLYVERRCAGPHCARTMLDRLDESDKPLSTCARCRLMRYCSPVCQQRDWKSGEQVPHKLLCPVLAKLQVLRDSEAMSEAQFAHLVDRCGFSEEQLARVGTWALSRGRLMQHHLRLAILSAT